LTEVEAFIRAYAPTVGIDPDVAVAVARSEGGLVNPFRRGEGPAPRSQAAGFGGTEHSFGPFQLYISGTNAGLGDRAVAAGVDPREDWKAGVQYALTEAANKGWGQWYGAANAGIDRWQGIARSEQPKQYALTPPDPYAGLPDGPKGQEAYKTTPKTPDASSVAVASADGALGLPGIPTGEVEAPKETLADTLSGAVSDLGDVVTGGAVSNTGGQVQRAVKPQAARMNAQLAPPPIDPMQAETQRQMLALAMQRLNAGRLF
jgi:hypothetical protein